MPLLLTAAQIAPQDLPNLALCRLLHRKVEVYLTIASITF